MRAGAIKGAFIFVLSPPPVSGLGNAGGFKLQTAGPQLDGENRRLGRIGGGLTMGRVYGNPQFDPDPGVLPTTRSTCPSCTRTIDRNPPPSRWG